MATSLGTNFVVVTRVHCISVLTDNVESDVNIKSLSLKTKKYFKMLSVAVVFGTFNNRIMGSDTGKIHKCYMSVAMI